MNRDIVPGADREEMSDEEKIRLLSTDGMLVKRPLVITGQHVLVGFKEKDWEVLLKKD